MRQQQFQPQAAINLPQTRYAIFLVYGVAEGPAHAEQVRRVCGNLDALLRAVGTRMPDAALSYVVAFGSDVWDRLFGPPRPRELHPFREFRSGPRFAPSTPGDLFFHMTADDGHLLRAGRADHGPASETASRPIDEMHGFRYFDDRDLTGFVDGTENPVGAASVAATIVGDEDPAFAGGSYVMVQKYLHDMPPGTALPTETQEGIIGRTKLDDIELDDAVKPTFAHNALTTIEENGQEIKILRHNMPFGNVGGGELGHLLHRLRALAAPDREDAGEHGRRPIRPATTTACWISPIRSPAAFLRAVCAVSGGRWRPATAACTAAGRTPRPLPRSDPGRRDGASTSAASKEFRNMNNLHRELAPISDAAWSQIEEEATRTLKRHLAGATRGGRPRAGRVRACQPSAPATSPDSTRPATAVAARLREVQPLVELRVAVRAGPAGDRRRGARRAGLRLAAGQGRRPAARVRRGPRHLRRLRRRRHPGHPPGHSNPVDRAARRCARRTRTRSPRRSASCGWSASMARTAWCSAPTPTPRSARPATTAIRCSSTSGGWSSDEIIWAPAIAGAFVLTTRGGDFALHIGQDVSIGYLSHTDGAVRLYLQETLTFLLLTAEAAVALSASGT